MSYSGGDVVTLPKPKVVQSATPVGTTWKSIPVAASAALPQDGVGSVFVRVTATNAVKSGRVLGRPLGSTSAGLPLLSFSKNRSESVGVLPLGADGSIQIKTSSGVPRLSIAVVSWVPKIGALVVPATPHAVSSSKVGTTRKTITVADGDPVPKDVVSALISVRTTASKPGRIALWTPGSPAPKIGDSFPIGEQTLLKSVRPSALGKLYLRTFSATANVQVSIVGWALQSSTVEATPAPAQLGSIKSGTSAAVTVAGTKGVPGTAQDVILSISASKGVNVSVWPQSAASGAPSASFTSRGGATTVLLPVPVDKKIRVRAAGSKGSAQVLATGWVSKLGDQQVSYIPKVGTTVIGPSDVVSMNGDTAVVRSSVGPFALYDHVMLRPADAPAAYVAQIVDVTTLDNGNHQLMLQNAPLSAAFDDFEANFSGAITQPLPELTNLRARVTRSGVSLAGLTPSIGLTFLRADLWTCDAGGLGVPLDVLDVDVDWSGTVHASIDLSEQVLDLSARGGIQVVLKARLPNAVPSITCSVSGQLPGQVTLGSTGLSLKLGGSGSMSISAVGGDGADVTMTGSARTYAAFFYSAGEVVRDGEIAFNGDVDVNSASGPNAAQPQGSLKIGVSAMVGPLEIPGFEESRWWEGGLTVGLEFRYGPPDPNDDEHKRVLMGPNCVDVTVGPYLEAGGSIVIPYWPDVSISLEPLNFPSFGLYKGPCWGYSGTITYERVGTAEKGTMGCTAQSCPASEWNYTWTKTLIPQAASFTRFNDIFGPWGSPVLQPYTWTYSKDYTVQDDVPLTYDGQVTTPCTWHYTGSGGGSVGWSTEAGHEYDTYIFQGWDPGSQAVANSGVPWAMVDVNVDASGDPDWCGQDSSNPESVEDYTSYSELTDLASYHQPVINATLSGHPEYHPEWGWTATLNLTRGEYPR